MAILSPVPEMLRQAAATYEERNLTYGDNYKKFGAATFPLLRHIRLEDEMDMNRLGILVMMMSKIGRYCENFNKGGHDDSLLDLAVYTTMLRELDDEMRREP
jgi:hypothetical protein